MAVTIALIPAPEGLALHGWLFFAVFVGVIVGLVAEPLPAPAISLIGVILVTVLAPWVLFSATDLSSPGFEPTSAALSWALSGFSNSTVWLIVGAFTFALGYEKTGLGRRVALVLVRALGRRTVTVAYAIVVADALLAPVTPSSTARTAGTIYPVVRSLPPLLGMPVRRLSLILVLCGGIMGILTPYAGGPNPVYYGSGYLPARDFWRLGAICGLLFFTVWMSFGLWLLPVD